MWWLWWFLTAILGVAELVTLRSSIAAFRQGMSLGGYQLLFMAEFIPLMPVLSPGSPLPTLSQGIFVAFLCPAMLVTGCLMVMTYRRRRA